MPEEIKEIEDLKREGISLKKEDIMQPEPSQEQVALWGVIEKLINEKILERENLFGSLPKDIRSLLASESTPDKLIEMSQRYNLTKDQLIALAHYIKSLFITFPKQEGVEIPKLINLLRLDLDINLEKAQALFQDVNNEILLPALKNMLAESEPSKQTMSPQPPTTPQPENENIVDLKSLPKP